MAERALVLGSTGYVGSTLVRRLCEEGHEVFAQVRKRARSVVHELEDAGATICELAVQAEALEKIIEKHQLTHVYFLIGTTKKLAKEEHLGGDIYQKVDYQLAHEAIKGAASAVPSPRFIYLSSVGAKEESPSAYLRVRGQVERELSTSGLSYLIARPSIITGADRPEKRTGERVAGAIGDGALRLFGALGATELRDRYRSTTAGVLATRLVKLGQSERQGVVEGADLRP